ncbi:26S proteasome non-ATPase regulatory subunit [Dirofilaria immitis]
MQSTDFSVNDNDGRIRIFKMTLYLLNQWRNQPGGAQNASAFLLALKSEHSSMREKELIIEVLDDWDVLTPTWFEVADYLSVIEGLHEDEHFKQRYLAALLASKVAFCLGDYNGALQLALAAEDKFQLTPRSSSILVGSQDEQYVNKIIEHALDTYKQAKRNEDEIDPRLEKLINRLFERNMKRRELRYVIGLALDTRRTDMILVAIKATDDQAALLTETVAKVLESQMDRAFRSIVLDLLLRLFAELEEPDFVSMCQCLIKLEKPDDVADILQRLVSNKGDNGVLLAYQIAFDLYENASQQFISKIEQSLIDNTPTEIASTSGVAMQPMEITTEGKIESQILSTEIAVTNKKEKEQKNNEQSKDASSSESMEEKDSAVAPNSRKQKSSNPEISASSEDVVIREVSKTSSSSDTVVDESKVMAAETSFTGKSKIKDKVVCKRLRSILRGEQTIKHHMQFLIKNNHTDMLILKQIKESVRTASAHNATVIANGLMHLGTTTDDFLRDNLEWISKATNWNKFNAVASLGLIHKGHEANALKLLDPYLPKGEADQFGFKEGGSLYAYVISYLRDQLLKATTSAARHGACLGLGLAAMGTHDEQVFVQLRDCLYQDDAVTGEAAGLAMGLVMVGGMQTEAYQEMVQYVCDTQHDKIQRGLRTGIALLAYGQQEEAEKLIAPLLEHKSNAVLRSTAVCMLAMAYAGSGKADVVRRLLAKVAADPNQDVKRFAVIAIGFVLSNDAEQCLSYTGMLAEHFNPHVRYGAAMALGISCAGSGYKRIFLSIREDRKESKTIFSYDLGTSLCFSTFTLSAISVDRFLLIYFPTRKALSRLQALIVIMIICILSTSLSAPVIFKQRLKTFGNYCGQFCTEEWGIDQSGRRIYGSIMLSVQFIVPLIIITFCYTAISFKLGKGILQRNRGQQNEWQLGMTDQQRAAVKRRQRTNRMLIGMVVAFSASWFFSVLFNVLRDYDYLPEWCQDQEYFFGIATHCIAMSSTVWNPLLYAALNLQLRAAFLRLLPECVTQLQARKSTAHNCKPLLQSRSVLRNDFTKNKVLNCDRRRRF